MQCEWQVLSLLLWPRQTRRQCMTLLLHISSKRCSISWMLLETQSSMYIKIESAFMHKLNPGSQSLKIV